MYVLYSLRYLCFETVTLLILCHFVQSLGWLLHEVYATYNTLRSIGHVEIRTAGNKYIHINDKVAKGKW